MTRHWTENPMGYWILNNDASWCERTKSGGIGWILRRWDGIPVTVGFRPIFRQWKVSWLEALTVTEGLKSIPQNSPKLIIELDSIQVVHLLEGNEEYVTKLALFVEEAKSFIEVLQVHNIQHIPERFNKMAHQLTHLACSTNSSHSWFYDFSCWLLDLNNMNIGVVNNFSGVSVPQMTT